MRQGIVNLKKKIKEGLKPKSICPLAHVINAAGVV